MTVGAMAASRPSPAALLPLLKPLLLLLPAFFLVLLLSLSRSSSSGTTVSDADGVAPFDLDVDVPAAGSGGEIRIRSGYRTYKQYIARQLNKTLDPRLRNLWTTRDWERKVAAFAAFFRRLQAEGLLHNGSRALCVGARTGQEVAALRRVGVADSIGLDLAPSPPLVVEGDFHRQPFPNQSFSNVFDPMRDGRTGRVFTHTDTFLDRRATTSPLWLSSLQALLQGRCRSPSHQDLRRLSHPWGPLITNSMEV